MFLFKIISILCLNILFSYALLLPDYLPKCKQAYNDEQAVELIECFIEKAHSLRDQMRDKGIPELGIPATNQIVIPEIAVEQTSRGYSYKMVFHQVHVYGLDKYFVKEGRFHPSNNTINGIFYFDKLEINGTYTLEGKIFDQFINQTGPVDATLSDIITWGQYNYSMNEKNDVWYAKLLDFTTEISIGDVEAKIDNLFGNNQVLNKATNEFIAQSAKQIVEAVKPEVKTLINNLIRSIVKVLLDKIPYDSLLKPRE